MFDQQSLSSQIFIQNSIQYMLLILRVFEAKRILLEVIIGMKHFHFNLDFSKIGKNSPKPCFLYSELLRLD